MDFKRLLQEIGLGRMKSVAYDTAWVARLGGDLGARAADWLLAHQLPDGSWGAEMPAYYYDRLVCTLVAVIALTERGCTDANLKEARSVLKALVPGLRHPLVGETIGFELIAPALLAEARTLGILDHALDLAEVLSALEKYRAAKLSALPRLMVNRFTSVAFSAEMAGPGDIYGLLDTKRLREGNGSVGCSPAATAYLVRLGNNDPAALDYLRRTVNGDGGIPNVVPFDIFEQAWVLWNLALTGPPDQEMLALCQPTLNFLQSAWVPGQGAGFAADYTPKDADGTSVVCEVLTAFGREVDLETLLSYEEGTHFRCFAMEANPSVSANVHVLGALKRAGCGVQHPSVEKILGFLRENRIAGAFWTDKWHVSPFYTTGHAILSLAGYSIRDLAQDAVDWILRNQYPDGSWGYFEESTAEETAYCLQALATWKQHGGQVTQLALRRGAAWLAEHAEPPYPPLWIGKCLYCPELVVQSAILSALMLAQ